MDNMEIKISSKILGANSNKKIHIQLDWNNPDQRELWQYHMMLSGANSMMRNIMDDRSPLSSQEKATVMALISGLFQAMHEDIWGRVYKAFPEMKGLDVTFNGRDGVYESSSPEEPSLSGNVDHAALFH